MDCRFIRQFLPKEKIKAPKLNCLRAFIFWVDKGLKAFTIYTFRTLDAWGPF